MTSAAAVGRGGGSRAPSARDGAQVQDSAQDNGKAAPVLIVDDLPSLRALYQSYLAEVGLHALTAASAREGIARFRTSGASIVLLDMFLPDGDGLDLLREMLALRPGVAVIMITADRSIGRAVEAIRSGAFDFLVKPVTSARLLEVVKNARAALRWADAPGTMPDAIAIKPAPPPDGPEGSSHPEQEAPAQVEKAGDSTGDTSAEGGGQATSEVLAALAGRPLAQIERMVIEAALLRHQGSAPRAAEELGIAASTIYRKLGQWRAEDS